MASKVSLLLFILGFTRLSGYSQQHKSYPQDYFRNPLNIPILLAGNFGECRPNHFHSGIDIKTQGKENLPVFASASGYVSRIKMEKGGFGHALYISHPKGYTTLYAHLNNFVAPIQQFLTRKQYEKESWAIDIELTPDQFPVKKGQQIGWSGNTGASTAPHLHFEIRDSKTEHPLNPLLFGFPIKDTRSPIPVQVSIYEGSQSIYNQSGKIFALKKAGEYYTPVAGDLMVNSEKVGIGLNVNDFMNGSDNTLNFYTAKWFLDDELQGSIVLDDIGYEETRYLHAYVDYKSRKEKGQWYQLLFQLPGNRLGHLYSGLNSENGRLTLPDTNRHQVKIELTDAAGNNSAVLFNIRAINNQSKSVCDLMFHPSSANKFESTNLSFSLKPGDLYDDVCFKFKIITDDNNLSDRYQVHFPTVPVHNYFDLKIKPTKAVAFEKRNKVVLMSTDGKEVNGKAASLESGWYKAAVRNFGTYWLTMDTIPPAIRTSLKQNANLAKARKITIYAKENLTSVQNFRAELDGKWILFEPKGDNYFYTFDEHCEKGKHTLVVKASDENNNLQTFIYSFTR
jgi:hypothetical protein